MFADAKITQVGVDKYNVSYGDDSGLFATFFWDAIKDEEASEREGFPVFRNVEMIRIMFPGDNTKEVIRKVKKEPSPHQPSDIDRFPKQWAAFQAQQEQVPDGYPLEHWPALDKATVMNLKARNIHTVEQLAAMTDANLSFMGARKLRDNAKAWLEEAQAGSAVLALRSENEHLRNEIEALKNMLKAAPVAPAKTDAITAQPEYSAPLASMPEPDIKPIKTRMRKKVENDGENTAATGTSSGE